MLQFYFLSVLLNILSGFVLVYASGKDNNDKSDYDSFDMDNENYSSKINKAFDPFVSFMNDLTFCLVLGSISAFVGLIKLFYTVQNDIAVLGDFLPSLAGLFGGMFLLFDYFDKKSEYGLEIPEFASNIIFGGKKYVGFFCIVAGFLHFIFPRVLFL